MKKLNGNQIPMLKLIMTKSQKISTTTEFLKMRIVNMSRVKLPLKQRKQYTHPSIQFAKLYQKVIPIARVVMKVQLQKSNM